MAFLPPLFRNELRKYVPWWLSDRRYSSGKTVGFRYLWVLVASLDVFVQFMLEALRAPWPGVGPEAALPYIGRTRGILRGPSSTVAEYLERLSRWLTKWARAGSAEQLLEELHEYLPTNPKVRLFTRSGICVTRNTDGTTVKETAAWDWDSVSDPQRAGNWWDVWIVVYSPYPARSGTLGDLTGADDRVQVLEADRTRRADHRLRRGQATPRHVEERAHARARRHLDDGQHEVRPVEPRNAA